MTTIPGSTNISDWRWYYNSDFSAPSTPFAYYKWGEDQPNNWGGKQDMLVMYQPHDFDFNDSGNTIKSQTCCFLCECP